MVPWGAAFLKRDSMHVGNELLCACQDGAISHGLAVTFTFPPILRHPGNAELVGVALLELVQVRVKLGRGKLIKVVVNCVLVVVEEDAHEVPEIET